ncbi:GNAT family N-acetyltransferase [Kribbella sp. VKM Ac-2568]|uniref:GNAT family N-acetyltransferase n=1 Tax=Kribbella sp. VKM Ac-2568 TaxID=2512219 RepID=UPI00105021A8|nr:GNAT family N-acetyltransferase [Kribbella sp. VKM Ac-2568]TCM36947.1 putative GNAT family acetyltransferase [Kribbella sp. VKM Ac-2568]
MTDQVLRPDGTGFYLAGGELLVASAAEQTVTGGRQVDFSVTAGLFGNAHMDLMLASWSNAQTDNLGSVRSEDGRLVLPLRTQPVMLNSLPSEGRVQLRTAGGLHNIEGDWQLVLQFRNHAGSSLTWHASLPAEAFGTGWLAPLADLLTIDGADSAAAGDAATSTPASPAVTVVHHADDGYYELLVDGQQAGLLVYHVVGSHLSITHTVIEQTYRGRGLSWALVGRALDDIRTRSVTVSNYCPVVSRFVEKNPDYRDLLSMPRPA